MKIEVDRVKCVGLGLCEAADPDHFEVGDDGKLVILQETFSEVQRRAVEEGRGHRGTECSSAQDSIPPL